jgi:putative sterol carrier protein
MILSSSRRVAHIFMLIEKKRKVKLMSANDILTNKIPGRLADASEREKMMALSAVFQFNLTGDEPGAWYVDLVEGVCAAGEHADADCTVTMESADFVSLYNGEAQGAMLFMSGKLQIDGNMGLAMQLGEIMG